MKALQAAMEQRAEVAPLMLDGLDLHLAHLNEILEKAETEQAFLSMGSKLLRKPSPIVLWISAGGGVEAKGGLSSFRRALGLALAGAQILLSETAHAELGSAVMAEIYDGDPSPLFDLLLDDAGDEDIRFWQWRTLIPLVLRGALDLDALGKFLVRAFDELEQEPEQHA